MSDEQVQTGSRRPKGRSPSYPAIDLETAIERARQLWDEERQHATPIETAVRHWGYKSISGPALTTISALKKFGLTEDEGKGSARRTRLTDLAVDVLHNPDERTRRDAIRRAALNPAIHRELWERYSSTLPSEGNLRWELTREMGFTETGADEFIPEYRATIAFAGLDDEGEGGEETPKREAKNGDTRTRKDEQQDETKQRRTDAPGSPTPDRQRTRPVSETSATYTIPITDGRSIVVEGEFPVTEKDWGLFMAVLTAMKPGLVRGETGAPAGA